MKKILLSLSITALSAGAFAQTTTWDFEAWTGNEPTGWISENELMLLGNPQSCFKESVPANVHSGSFSMNLLSVTMTNNPGNSLPNPIGLAAPGKLVSFVPKFGIQYTARPNAVDFWYKYTPVLGDTAEFLITLWNSATGDTLAAGYWKTGATVSTYASQTVTLTYNPAFSTEFPDSMALTFSSTKLFNPDYSLCLNCGAAGSNLWVDDINFTGWNGINEHPSSNNVIVYPNPSTNYANIIADVAEAASVNIYDVTGKMVSSSSLEQTVNMINRKEGVINTSKFSAGIYSYSILDKSGTSLRNGKFSVVH